MDVFSPDLNGVVGGQFSIEYNPNTVILNDVQVAPGWEITSQGHSFTSIWYGVQFRNEVQGPRSGNVPIAVLDLVAFDVGQSPVKLVDVELVNRFGALPQVMTYDANVAVWSPEEVDQACSAGGDIHALLAGVGSMQGDVDFDGEVGFSDFLKLTESFGLPGNYSDGDVDCDGLVEFSDYLIVGNKFGQSAPAIVPEPSTALLGAFGLLLSLLPRRKRA